MAKLLASIRKRQEFIASLRKEHTAIGKRIAAVEEELREALAALHGGAAELDKPKSRHGFVNGRRARPIQRGSSVWWTAKVLYLVGQAMHIDKILPRIAMESGHHFEKATVVSNLSRYVKYGDTFNRPAPNVFGLIDFSTDIEHPSREDKEEE